MSLSKTTIRRAEKILGYGIDCIQEDRTYPVIDGVVYTDAFEGDVELAGYTGTFKPAFNGKSTGMEYYNELKLTGKCLPKQVTVLASWGSSCLNKELADLFAWIEGDDFADSADGAGVRSLKIEDFSITKGTSSDSENSLDDTIKRHWSFYIRNPMIISVSPEHLHDYRYF